MSDTTSATTPRRPPGGWESLPRWPSPGRRLTTRQVEILDALGDGLTQVEVGRRLHITSPTVSTQLRRIRIKMSAPTTMRALIMFRADRPRWVL